MRVAWIGEGGKCRGEIEDELPPEFKKFINDNAESIAYEIEAIARASTNFKDETGKLRRSIKARRSKYEEGGWIVGAWAPHAWVVEYGHDLINPYTGKNVGHVGGKSYLRGALNAAISSARAKFGAR